MSFVYVKSQEYLNNQDGTNILENGSLPYLFTNTFTEPLKITSKTTIELVSGDLNIAPIFKITSLAKNNILSFALGNNTNGFFQVSIRVPDGEYSDVQLSNEIQTQIGNNNNMDMAAWKVSYDSGKFNIELNIQNGSDDVWDKQDNIYHYLSKNIGFQEEPVTGVGSGDSTAEIISHPTNHQIQSTNVARILNNPKTQATGQSPFLLSNSFTPNSNGLLQNGGNVSMIVRPIQQYTFNPATFYTNSAASNIRYRFSQSIGGGNRAYFQYQNALLSPYTGSNGYDFQLPNRYFKIMTEADFANTTFPTGTVPVLDKNYVPWGHWLICNVTDIPVPTAITSNYFAFYLDSDGTTATWKEYRANYGNPDLWFEQDMNVQTPTFIQSQTTKVSLGKYGSAALSLTRGETAISGTNQVNTENKYTRARVVNTTPKTALEYVDNQVFADYTLQLTPNVSGTDTLINMGYGVQDPAKVAGDTDWLSLTNQTQEASNSLISKLGSGFNWGVDNIMITATMFNYTCCKFSINHDVGGNLVFSGQSPVVLGTTMSAGKPPSALLLPMNFTGGSFPIMPIISTANSYTVKDPMVLVTGNYSIQSISKNLKNVSAYMTAQFGNTRTIPIRQPYLNQTGSTHCFETNLLDRTQLYSPNGFSGQTGQKTFLIKKAVVKATGSQGKIKAIVRFNLIDSYGEDYDTLIANGYLLEPNNFSKLGGLLGFKDLLTYIPPAQPKITDTPSWSSTSTVNANGTPNYMINVGGIGNVRGNNGANKSISNLVGVISDFELTNTVNSTERHYNSGYSNPVSLNAPGDELVRNFDIKITRDDGRPAINLSHPSSFLFKLNN
jgi:hypothetical protein